MIVRVVMCFIAAVALSMRFDLPEGLAEFAGGSRALNIFYNFQLSLTGTMAVATLIFAGCLEMTTGSSLLAANLPFLSALSGALFFTVWGGFCIMAQTITVMKGSGLPFFPYFFLKLAHGILSALLIFLLLLL